MKMLRLLGVSFSLSLRRELAFRANLFFQVLLTIFDIVSGLLVLGTVYTRTQTLAGWHFGDALVLLGTFQIVSGLYQTFIEPNLSWFSGQVNSGKLDHVLVQPIASLFLVSLGRCAPLALSQTALGLLVTGAGLSQLGALPSWWEGLSWLVLVGTGLVMAWVSRVLLACLAFWTPSIELNMLYAALWQFGRYPVEIYRQPLRFFLTYILPFAFFATFPASALTGHANLLLALPGLVVGLVAILLVRLVWRLGLRRYTSATS